MGLVSHGALRSYYVEWGYGDSYSFVAGKAYYSPCGPVAAWIVVKCEIPRRRMRKNLGISDCRTAYLLGSAVAGIIIENAWFLYIEFSRRFL